MGRKEDNVRKAQAIIHKPEFIRNIGTVAHVDHGKCVSGRTRIWVNGQWVPAERLWQKFADRQAVPNDYDAEVREVLGDSLWTHSVSTETGASSLSQITHVWRLPAREPLVEVETRDGRKIQTTPEHKFVVPSRNRLQFREARGLQVGDFVAVPRRLPSRDDAGGWSRLEGRVLHRLASDPRFLFELVPEAEQALDVSGKIRGPRLLEAIEERSLDPSRIYPLVRRVTYRLPRWRGVKSASPMRLPARNGWERFFRYMGLLYGDGDGAALLHNGDETILREAVNVLQGLVPRPKIGRYRERVPRVEPRSKTLQMFLHVVFGYPRVRKSRSIRVPDVLFEVPLPLVTAFLQGYLDAGGTVEKGRSAVSMTSVSEPFLDGLQLLLLRLGIRGILRRQSGKNTLYVSGRTNLERLPRFQLWKKAAGQEALEEKARTSYVVDLVPVDWSRFQDLDWKARDYENAGRRPSPSKLLALVGPEAAAVEPLLDRDVCFVEVRAIRSSRTEWVYDFSVPSFRNFVAEGFFVHNTTLSDSLIAGAGMMSEELAGQQLELDYDEQEQARGITINAAVASMVHDFEGEEYLVNLIDTPGHVDFGGDVTRAMRAIDGAILVVDAVEGVMPQTETVIRQALKERVRIVLFINKVDRLIDELKIDPDEMQQRFLRIIAGVNKRIAQLLPDELKKAWQVKVEEGNVAFGSATLKWAISVPFMQETGLTFKDIYQYHEEENVEALAKLAPLHRIVLNMIIRHMPDPLVAQKLRIPIIWKGPPDAAVGRAMMEVDGAGPVAFVVTKIIIDPHAGEVAVGRLFSGTMRQGQEAWVLGMPKPERLQTVNMVVGPDRIRVDEITAGNVAAIVGLKAAISGSTVAGDPEMIPFERIVHYSEPVVTVAIEAKHTRDLPKLVEVLRMIGKADPSIQVDIDQETGEHLMSGMGELHLEITNYRIVHEYGVDIDSSPPIVVYRESVQARAGPFEGKSPNKHNRFYLEVEPLEEAVVQAILGGEIPTNRRVKRTREFIDHLRELGMGKNESRKVVWIQDNNMLLDMTKGIQYLHETIELVREAFIEAATRGPLAGERCMGVKVRLVDAKLHEDSIHRGPAQVIPASRSAIYGAMVLAGRVLLEPKQKVVLNLSQEVMGAAIAELQSRRSVIEDIEQEGDDVTITAKAPVAEMFGFATAIRSATAGRVLWSYENAGFERLPTALQDEVVAEIRTRKGLRPEPYDANYYAA